MIIKSKIKEIFSPELLKLIASICDTRLIDSNQRKMKILQQLLVSYDVQFEVLGGATNRIALLIDTYAVKFAMDQEGYHDNFMEYSLSAELQPYVTKTYETNGYILIAECVKTMTLEEFNFRRSDIKNVLHTVAQEYLLGDVGLVKRNFTNWGIRDNGTVCILDYAYMHRATEGLFTCEQCGDGFLSYSEDFTKLICSNKSVCGKSYTYDDRKRIQGTQVDIDMIDENKGSSIVMGKGVNEKDITSSVGDVMIDSDVIIIRNADDVYKIREDVYNKMAILANNENAINDLDDLIDLVKHGTVCTTNTIVQEVDIPKEYVPKIAVSSDCEVEVQFDEYGMPYIVDQPPVESEDNKDLSFDDIVNLASGCYNGTIPMMRSKKNNDCTIDNNDTDGIDELIDRLKGVHHE